MVDKIHYRWDFIQLSTDQKPTPENSEKVVNGSTLYESDTSKLYVFYKDTWYEKTATGGGGGGGTSDYPDLTNKPKINNVELNGNKTSSDLGLQPAGNYVTFDDYATSSTTGVVKTSAQYGVTTSSYTKNLTGSTKTYADYQNGNDVVIICKGTLENVLIGKGLNQIVTLTQQEYDALTTKDSNTYYYIVEE